MKKTNIILADCEKEEIEDFAKGLEEISKQKFFINTAICNGKHSLINNIKRYFIYMIYPIKFIFFRKRYKYIIGWQQFFALFYVLYCNIFKIKKVNIVIACNFTYKSKRGFKGKIYKKLMGYCIKSKYLDYMHVPSELYALECSKEFNVPMDKFIVIPFGIPDTLKEWENSKVEYKNYVLAIGRSNRDYDFLIRVWKRLPESCKLLIVCDQYKHNKDLPNNIIIRRDIVGNQQFPYIYNCSLMIIPIKQENICSGDTVLLKAMSFNKVVVVTKPSTLSEVYIENKKNGICLEKSEESFAKEIKELLEDKELIRNIEKTARESYLNNYSRYAMGKKIGQLLK